MTTNSSSPSGPDPAGKGEGGISLQQHLREELVCVLIPPSHCKHTENMAKIMCSTPCTGTFLLGQSPREGRTDRAPGQTQDRLRHSPEHQDRPRHGPGHQDRPQDSPGHQDSPRHGPGHQDRPQDSPGHQDSPRHGLQEPEDLLGVQLEQPALLAWVSPVVSEPPEFGQSLGQPWHSWCCCLPAFPKTNASPRQSWKWAQEQGNPKLELEPGRAGDSQTGTGISQGW
ncbi:hypothetical protein TURU_164571 [Turdus rufiventris]|nr:hypothetical protein TURU_164571 [Turdus rufiventris]